MKSKIVALSLTAILAVGTLAGCGGTKPAEEQATTDPATQTEAAAEPTADGKSADGKTVLSFYWWGNQKRNEVTKQAVDLYMKNNPNVEIKLEFTDWSGYWDKLSASAAGGNMPDIIQQDYAFITQYQQSNQLANLSEFIDSGIIKTDKIPKPILESGMIDGKVYAISTGSNAPTMTYDVATVKEAGIEIPVKPTIDELYALSETVFDKTGTKSHFEGNLNNLTMIARSRGSYIFDELKEGKTDSTKIFFDVIDKFSKAKFALSPDILAEKNADVVETKPIIDSSSWNDYPLSNQFIAIANTAGREFAMCMLPSLADAKQENMYLKPGMFLSISETSKNKEEAAKFVDWFTNSVECNEILLAERGVPINTDVMEAIKPKVDPITAKTFDFIAEVSKVAVAIDPPDPAGRGEVEAILKTTVEKVRYGELTTEEAAAEFATQAQKVLSEAKAE